MADSDLLFVYDWKQDPHLCQRVFRKDSAGLWHAVTLKWIPRKKRKYSPITLEEIWRNAS